MKWNKRKPFFQWFIEMARGFRAVVTQSYTEANVKNGVQFTLSSYQENFLGKAVSYMLIVTGDVPFVMKGRTYQYDGLGLKTEIFKNPIASGGTPLTPKKLNDLKDTSSTVQFYAEPVVTTEGDSFTSPRYYIGSNPGGSRSTATVAQEIFGLETIFKPNSTYLVKTTSLDADAQRVSLYATWYEGDLDFS